MVGRPEKFASQHSDEEKAVTHRGNLPPILVHPPPPSPPPARQEGRQRSSWQGEMIHREGKADEAADAMGKRR